MATKYVKGSPIRKFIQSQDHRYSRDFETQIDRFIGLALEKAIKIANIRKDKTMQPEHWEEATRV